MVEFADAVRIQTHYPISAHTKSVGAAHTQTWDEKISVFSFSYNRKLRHSVVSRQANSFLFHL